jgi:hypothetical protein
MDLDRLSVEEIAQLQRALAQRLQQPTSVLASDNQATTSHTHSFQPSANQQPPTSLASFAPQVSSHTSLVPPDGVGAHPIPTYRPATAAADGVGANTIQAYQPVTAAANGVGANTIPSATAMSPPLASGHPSFPPSNQPLLSNGHPTFPISNQPGMAPSANMMFQQGHPPSLGGVSSQPFLGFNSLSVPMTSQANRQRLSSAAAHNPRQPRLQNRGGRRRGSTAIHPPGMPRASRVDDCYSTLSVNGANVDGIRLIVKVYPPKVRGHYRPQLLLPYYMLTFIAGVLFRFNLFLPVSSGFLQSCPSVISPHVFL